MKRYVIVSFFLLVHLHSWSQNFTGPSVSRDGKFLVFRVEQNGDRALYVSNADGTGIRLLIDIEGSEIGPDWSPDGEKIVFYSAAGGDTKDLYTVGKNGESLKNLTNGKLKNVQTPGWASDDDITFSYGEFPSVNIYRGVYH